ncbi:hypothetical protein PG999_007747 [Apiospora kogelbergensis]|uniref:Transmembrane protein n=2 Tax=Apiospora kogelbergensis TaxID=1337665 RepID=A0AAW0QS49_9PEZI
MFTGLKVHKVLDHRATLVFHRLQRFYQIFNVIATLLGGLALAVLTFDEYHDEQKRSLLVDASAGLMTSSAITAVVAVMSATMLLFKFEGHERPTRMELAISWVPLVLVDVVIVEFLVGLVLWYAAQYSAASTAVMTLQLAGMLAGTIAMAIWMWNTMSQRSGLGAEETRTATESSRVADN